jgi:hypothetical protein
MEGLKREPCQFLGHESRQFGNVNMNFSRRQREQFRTLQGRLVVLQEKSYKWSLRNHFHFGRLNAQRYSGLPHQTNEERQGPGKTNAALRAIGPGARHGSPVLMPGVVGEMIRPSPESAV